MAFVNFSSFRCYFFFIFRDEKEFQGEELDSCRIYGKLDVNKVAGNFHITAGK